MMPARRLDPPNEQMDVDDVEQHHEVAEDLEEMGRRLRNLGYKDEQTGMNNLAAWLRRQAGPLPVDSEFDHGK